MPPAPSRLFVPIALLCAVTASTAASAPDPNILLSGTWDCTVSSPMKGDPNYRLYSGAYSFDARFLFSLRRGSGNRITGTVVAEKWTSGAQTLTEMAAAGFMTVNNLGRHVAYIEGMSPTQAHGNQKIWPRFQQAALVLTEQGGIYADIAVGEGGDIATGTCRAF